MLEQIVAGYKTGVVDNKGNFHNHGEFRIKKFTCKKCKKKSFVKECKDCFGNVKLEAKARKLYEADQDNTEGWATAPKAIKDIYYVFAEEDLKCGATSVKD